MKPFLVLMAAAAASLLVWLMYEHRESDLNPIQQSALESNDKDQTTVGNPPQEQVVTSTESSKLENFRREFEDSEDLSLTVALFKERAMQGDALAARFTVEALEECFSLSINPAGEIDFLKQQIELRTGLDKERSEQQLDRLLNRCGRLAEAAPVTVDELKLWNEMAVNQGDLTSSIKSLINPSLKAESDSDLADMNALIEKAIQAKDADALLMASKALGVAADKYGIGEDLPAGTALAGYAWELAACDLGAPCGPRSEMLSGLCLRYGLCGYSTLSEAYSDGALTQRQYQQALEMKSRILALVHSG